MADATGQGRSLPRLAALKDRLEYLFQNVEIPGRQKSLRYMEKWIRDYASRDATGQTEPMTHNYLANLMRGEQDNPSMKKVVALARYFDVPPAYLLGDFDSADQPRVAVLAAKARGLRERDLRVVEGLVDSLLQPDDRDPPGH